VDLKEIEWRSVGWSFVTQGRDKWWALCEDNKKICRFHKPAALSYIRFSVVRYVSV
jgi:hypothetical protein